MLRLLLISAALTQSSAENGLLFIETSPLDTLNVEHVLKKLLDGVSMFELFNAGDLAHARCLLESFE